MKCLEIIFLANLAINSASSSAISGNSNSPSRKNYTTKESGICPMNSSISVKVFHNLRGQWLTTFVDHNKLRNFIPSIDQNLGVNVIVCGDSRYIKISDILKDTDADNSSGSTVGDYMKNTNGETNDCCKETMEFNSIAENYANEARKGLEAIEQRMSSFVKTLSNIEGILNQLRGISNASKDLENTEDKENATLKSTPLNTKSSAIEFKENVTTCPPCPTNTNGKVKEHKIFDAIYKGRKVELSSDLRTATRTKPLEDFGHYAGVISKAHLEEDEVFQVRIEETMTKWSELGIGIGVIRNKTEEVEGAMIIYFDIEGTWAIRSRDTCIIGKSNIYKDTYITYNGYDGYPLDTRRLPVGTVLGISRRKNGSVHFYLNGVDKGPAFGDVPKDVYAFVDVTNYVTKITILN